MFFAPTPLSSQAEYILNYSGFPGHYDDLAIG
jgi:hypothetical protein